MDLKVGQAIHIIKDIKADIFDYSGWKGYVTLIDQDGFLENGEPCYIVEVVWDIPHLEQMDKDFMELVDVHDIDFETFYFYLDKIEYELVTLDNTIEEIQDFIETLEDQQLEESRKKLEALVRPYQKASDQHLFAAWCRYLKAHIPPSTKATYNNPRRLTKGLKYGSPLYVEVTMSYDKKRGVLGLTKKKNKSIKFLMQDIVLETDESAQEALDKYVDWLYFMDIY